MFCTFSFYERIPADDFGDVLLLFKSGDVPLKLFDVFEVVHVSKHLSICCCLADHRDPYGSLHSVRRIISIAENALKFTIINLI